MLLVGPDVGRAALAGAPMHPAATLGFEVPGHGGAAALPTAKIAVGRGAAPFFSASICAETIASEATSSPAASFL